MAFKKGDVVEAIAGKAGPISSKYVNKPTVVLDVNIVGSIRLDEDGGYFRADKFRLVKEAPLAFAVGAQVERIGEDTLKIIRGRRYIIETVYLDALGGVAKIKLQGINASYHVRGFKVVANAPAKEWIPQVGEKVCVVGKDEMHAPASMDEFINDGIPYEVVDAGPRWGHKLVIMLSNGYGYLTSSLKPVAPGFKKPVPPPEPTDLRERLYQRQHKRGYGSLCSFAFEGKDGRVDFQIDAPCHAALSRPNVGGEVLKMAYNVRHDLARYKKYEKSDAAIQAYTEYLDYILNRSPWAVAYITKDVKEAMEQDVFMNVECNRFVIAGACLALRCAQEYPERPAMFKMVKDHGHSEHTAWVFCCAFGEYDGYFQLNGWGGGHDLIDKCRDLNDIVKFFNEGYFLKEGKNGYDRKEVFDEKPFRTHHGQYIIAGAVAKYSADNSIHTWLDRNVKSKKTGEGWNTKTIITKDAVLEAATKFDNLLKGKA